MIITPEQIGQLATGIANWHFVDGAFHANRIPGRMRPIYLETEAATVRMNCPSCVRIRFTSDTACIKASFRYRGGARKKYRATLLVDGQPHSHPGPADGTDSTEWTGTIFENATQAARQFDLWLPPWAVTEIVHLEIADDRPVQGVPPPALRWLVYGDSITQGMDCGTAASHHIARCALALNADVLNVAIGGAILDRRLALTVPPGRFDIVSIAYGTNDISRGIAAAEFLENMQSLIRSIHYEYPEVPIVLVSNPPVPGRVEPDPHNQSIADYRKAVASLHQPGLGGIYVVDGSRVVPNEPQWFVDNVHPNDEGFAHYTNALLPVLREAIGTR